MVASKMQKLVAAAPLTQEEADACELVLRSLNLEPSLFTAISELLEFRDQAELETSFNKSAARTVCDRLSVFTELRKQRLMDSEAALNKLVAEEDPAAKERLALQKVFDIVVVGRSGG